MLFLEQNGDKLLFRAIFSHNGRKSPTNIFKGGLHVLTFNFQEEKLELLNLLERVPIPIKESIEEASAKVSITLSVINGLF